jgi:hypothetical protein
MKGQNSEAEVEPKKYIGISLNGYYSANTVRSNTQKQFSISTAPFFGFRVKKFVFGTAVGVGYNYVKTPYASYLYSTKKTIEITLLPTIRYYTKFNLFLTSSFIIGRGKGETISPFSDSRSITYTNLVYTSKIIGGSVGLGYAIKAGKSFLIEPQISFQKTYHDADYEYNNTSTTFYLTNYKYSENRDYSNFYAGLGTIYRF